MLESFYSGSHALFADGLVAHSSHDIDLITMPGENWRWRILGSALYFAEKAVSLDSYDGLIVTDLFNLPDFLALTGGHKLPVLVYYHENQITYPQPPGDRHAFQTGIVNITTALAADRVIFNSKHHMTGFISAAGEFLNKTPDCPPANLQETIAQKASVLYPGVSMTATPPAAFPSPSSSLHPLIIWNHRWAYDKNGKPFFHALDAIADQGVDFRLAILGENFGRIPPAFADARERFQDRIVQFGYVKSRRQYLNWLTRGDIVVSTANQENFGMAVVEAALCGCIPLLPGRLSYPEIIPPAFHDACLYKNQDDLISKLAALLTNARQRSALKEPIGTAMQPYLWENRIGEFDGILETLAER